MNGAGAVWPANTQVVLSTTAIVTPTTTTTYYMLCSATFSFPTRVNFNSANSSFKSIRIA